MAKPMLQRKRSSACFEEKAVMKRQFSERTLMASQLENSLHLENVSPAVEDQVPSLSPKDFLDGSFYFDSRVSEKDCPVKKSTPDIERERCPDEQESDDYCLSEDVENQHVSFEQAVVDDVLIIPVKTQTTDVEQQGEDEPDGLGEFLGRIADKVADTLLPLHHHDHHHDHEGFPVHLPAHKYDTPSPFGARLRRSNEGYALAQVFNDTAAHKAGLRESDIVTHLNDTELKTLDICEIQKLFMHADTVFKLTILRKCEEGNEVHLKKTIIKFRIGDEILVEVVHKEVVRSRKPRYIDSSPVSYIAQDGVEVPQIYLNVSGDRVTMGSHTDERAHFYLDFYAVMGELPIGQRCVIRNVKTNQIYDAVQNNMKTVNNYLLPDQACMLDKIPRSDGTFVFESVHLRDHYLTYQRSSNTLKLSEYPGLSAIAPEGSFDVIDAKVRT